MFFMEEIDEILLDYNRKMSLTNSEIFSHGFGELHLSARLSQTAIFRSFVD